MILQHRLDGPDGAPVLVLSASLGTTLDLWEPQLPALTERFRVLRHDHPGHAGAPQPPPACSVEWLAGELLALLDALGIERFSLCGLSLGGAVGLTLGAVAPERLERLVLACTSARFATPEAWEERARTVRQHGLEAIVEAAMGRWFTARLRAARPALVERFAAMLCSTSPEGYARWCDALAVFDFRPRLGEVRTPALVLAGAEDPITPPADGEQIAAGIADGRLVVLGAAAHLASVEQPEAFTAAVLDGLADGSVR